MPPSTTHYTPTAAQGLPPRTFHVVAKATNALTAYCLPLEREATGPISWDVYAETPYPPRWHQPRGQTY
jgi:hypothetical protein